MDLPTSARGSSDQQHNRLACQACQRKKIKCDRTFPCGQCTRSGLQCVNSQRKPRARHAGKRAVDSELRTRITKLESLVESLSGEVANNENTPDDRQDQEPKSTEAASPAVGKYMSTQFWSSFSNEVQALRDALEDQEEESPESNTTAASEDVPDTNATNAYDLLICPPGMVFVMPGALAEPSSFVTAELYRTFVENVTPIISIFHVPSLRKFISGNEPYFGLDVDSPPCRALKAAIWFAAVNTLSEVDCQSRFGQKKPDLLQQYRRCVEVRLSQADLFKTSEMATVQALLVYIIAERTSDTSRRTWTLTATLVRIATAMDLHLEVQGKSPFEMEMRRRLWHQVRLVDIFQCGDRGTPTLIIADSYSTLYPKNVNDSEIDENSIIIPDHETGLTDMSYAMLVFESTRTTQRLNFPGPGRATDTWPQRVQVAEEFKTRIEKKVLQYCDPKVPFNRFLMAAGKTLISGMLLRAVRPVQQHLSSPPRVDNPYVLSIAIDTLRHEEKYRDDAETERWRFIPWVQWQPLSVALASLCMIRNTPLSDIAWVHVQRAYKTWPSKIADASDGMLWRPIEKLYKKATAFRDNGRHEPAATALETPIAAKEPAHLTTASYVHTPATQRAQPRPLGSIPIDPIMSTPMDFDIDVSNVMADMNMNIPPQTQPQGQPQTTDEMNWLDWESIMNDFVDPIPPDEMVTLGDMQPPGFVPQGADWPCPLHSDLA